MTKITGTVKEFKSMLEKIMCGSKYPLFSDVNLKIDQETIRVSCIDSTRAVATNQEYTGFHIEGSSDIPINTSSLYEAIKLFDDTDSLIFEYEDNKIVLTVDSDGVIDIIKIAALDVNTSEVPIKKIDDLTYSINGKESFPMEVSKKIGNKWPYYLANKAHNNKFINYQDYINCKNIIPNKSKIKVKIICSNCNEISFVKIGGLKKRIINYPICNKCICKITSNLPSQRKVNSEAQLIAQNKPEQILANSLGVRFSKRGNGRYYDEYYMTRPYKKLFYKLSKKLDYNEYGGAIVLGVNGINIITHGSSKAKAIKNGIKQAFDYYKMEIVEKMKTELATIKNVGDCS